jgi:hypothetical protein
VALPDHDGSLDSDAALRWVGRYDQVSRDKRDQLLGNNLVNILNRIGTRESTQ